MSGLALAARRGNEVVTPPVQMPLSIAEVKEHARIDLTDEDAYLGGLIGAVTAHTERYLCRSLITQTRRAWFDVVPCDGLLLDFGPVQTLSSVKSYSLEDTESTLASTVYRLDAVSEPARVVLRYNQIWPVNLRPQSAVAAQYVAGYGLAGDSVPTAILQGMLLLIGHWYLNREAVVTGTIATTLPLAVESLLRPYRLNAGVA
jgi:uncharacterized phiE125 gp8 family phage protein